MAENFYPWVNEATRGHASSWNASAPLPETPETFSFLRLDEAPQEARIAVLDSVDIAPRIVVVEPQPIRSYVDELTQTTYGLAKEQGGSIPFMVIREVVENLIHAYFTDPVVTIFPGGNTIRFADRGPGIPSKEQALEFGTTTATEAMKHYIRGVGFGLPYVHNFMDEHGGALSVEDNLSGGTIVTLSLETQRAVEIEPGEKPTPASNPLAETLPTLSRTERDIVAYLAKHEDVGPKELVATYGSSSPTWSRRLAALEGKGIVEKIGQKRRLTPLGQRVCMLVAANSQPAR